MADMKKIVALFDAKGTVESIVPLGEGLINDTFLVRTLEPEAPDYVLQRINRHVFPDVEMVMRNISSVTAHIRHKLELAGTTDIDRRVLTFVRLRDDAQQLYAEVEDECWRMSRYIPRSVTKQQVDTQSSREAGRAFGEFQALLADLKTPLGETIKNFHNMEFRLEQLREAVKEDRAGRLRERRVQALLIKIERRANDMCRAERMGREGALPKRVCHCDTKVNNILFDEGGDVLCVIDLDTVMPSFVFSDYGDFLRSAANTEPDDSARLDEVDFRMDIFEAFTAGYLESARCFLLPQEVDNLPYAAQLFPYMQCVRFLWDYLQGDLYWKCSRPDHNLVRAENQMRLLLSAEEKEPEMRDIIKRLNSEL